MKLRRRALCALVAILIVFGTVPACLAAEAADSEVGTRSSYFFNSYNVSLGNRGSGRIVMTFSVTGYQVADELGVTMFKIQKRIDGQWTYIGSWYTGSIGTNTISHAFSRNLYGIVGETYRVHAIFYCENSYGTADADYFSASITATA